MVPWWSRLEVVQPLIMAPQLVVDGLQMSRCVVWCRQHAWGWAAGGVDVGALFSVVTAATACSIRWLPQHFAAPDFLRVCGCAARGCCGGADSNAHPLILPS